MDAELSKQSNPDKWKQKWPRYMWVLLAIFLLVVIVIIAVIVYVDQTKDEEDDNVKGNQGSSNLVNRLQPSNYTVLILGAGVAGVRAAQLLSEVGANIQIIEGSDRIGGRLKAEQLAGIKLEVGSTWIYGSDQRNPIFRLANKLNLTTTLTDYESYVFRDDTGSDVTEQADELYGTYEEALERVDELRDLKERNRERDITVRKALGMYKWWDDAPLKKAWEYFEIDFELGFDASGLSLLYNMGDDIAKLWGDDELYVTDQRGHSIIVHHMADNFLENNDPRLHLNSVVTDVHYNSSGVKVKTSTGETYEADFALMTFPIGVLQNDAVNFIPEMPRWKREPIFKVDVAHYAHIFLKFDVKFWDNEEWLLHANSRKGYYPVFSDFDSHLTETQLQDFGPTNILMVGLTEREAYRVTALSDDEIKEEIMSVLRGIYGNNIPDPTGILASRWSHDPLHYGSWPNRPYAFDDKLMANLKKPLGRLYFAGDAYHDTFDGYMHAAYFSADEQVEAMLRCMRTNC